MSRLTTTKNTSNQKNDANTKDCCVDIGQPEMEMKMIEKR